MGKHLSMVKENIMKIMDFFFHGTNNYPCMVKENRMKIIHSSDIRSTRFKHTRIIRFFCSFLKIRPKIRTHRYFALFYE